jgi:type II secretory pathway component GspD/PulD (secretin)
MMQRIGLLSFLVLASGCASSPESGPPPQAAQAQMPAPPPVMQVVPLKFALADELSKVIVQALGSSHRKGFRVVADARTNSLVLTAENEADLASALDLISKLDIESTKAPEPTKVPEANKAPEAPKAP